MLSVSQLILVLDTFLSAAPEYFNWMYFYTSSPNVTFCLRLTALSLWLTEVSTGKTRLLIFIWMYKKPQDKDLGNIHLFNLFSVATTIHKAPKDPCFLVFNLVSCPSITFLEARRLKQGTSRVGSFRGLWGRVPCLSPSSGGCWQSLVFLSLWTHHSNPCHWLQWLPSLSPVFHVAFL